MASRSSSSSPSWPISSSCSTPSRPYYEELLNAGVRIYLYPQPTVLHAKFFTVDDVAGVIGSSNMDYRSFGLDYEISLMGDRSEFRRRSATDLRRVPSGLP